MPIAIAISADANGARIAEARPRQRCAGGKRRPNDREVGVGIAADDIGAKRSAIGQRHREARRTMDDVAVREDEAVRGEDDTGPAAALGVDLHDRRPNHVDRLNHRTRVRVEEIVVVRVVRVVRK